VSAALEADSVEGAGDAGYRRAREEAGEEPTVDGILVRAAVIAGGQRAGSSGYDRVWSLVQASVRHAQPPRPDDS